MKRSVWCLINAALHATNIIECLLCTLLLVLGLRALSKLDLFPALAVHTAVISAMRETPRLPEE